jgi:hypothetical protein
LSLNPAKEKCQKVRKKLKDKKIHWAKLQLIAPSIYIKESIKLILKEEHLLQLKESLNSLEKIS